MDLESNAFLIKVGELQAIVVLKHPSCNLQREFVQERQGAQTL